MFLSLQSQLLTTTITGGPEANPDFEATNERYEPRHRCVKILAYCRYCKRSGQNIGEEHYRGCRCYEGGWWEGLKWVERPKPLLDYEVRDHGCNACLGRRARMFKRMEKESRPNSMKVVERTVRRRQS